MPIFLLRDKFKTIYINFEKNTFPTLINSFTNTGSPFSEF